MSEIANREEDVYVRGRPDGECEREVGKEKKWETEERRMKERMKTE